MRLRDPRCQSCGSGFNIRVWGGLTAASCIIFCFLFLPGFRSAFKVQGTSPCYCQKPAQGSDPESIHRREMPDKHNAAASQREPTVTMMSESSDTPKPQALNRVTCLSEAGRPRKPPKAGLEVKHGSSGCALYPEPGTRF